MVPDRPSGEATPTVVEVQVNDMASGPAVHGCKTAQIDLQASQGSGKSSAEDQQLYQNDIVWKNLDESERPIQRKMEKAARRLEEIEEQVQQARQSIDRLERKRQKLRELKVAREDYLRSELESGKDDTEGSPE
jgi:chromosome segregation ATPase